MIRIGIDEAGRGPVLGPLVITGIRIPLKHHEYLKDKGVKDSKDLKPCKRNTLSTYLEKTYPTHTVFISANKIDTALSKSISLNTVEKQAMNSIITTFKQDHVLIDCPIKNTKHWEKQFDANVTAENKADQNHVDVAAASIIAKTKRDKYMHNTLGPKAGSGYPSDPTTKLFLEDLSLTHIELRKTWKTVKDLKTTRTQQTLS